jgi:hypothetical protein
MAYTAQQMLAHVNTCIQARLTGDSYEEYGEGPDRFSGTSLDDLYKIRERLTRLINTSGSPFFKPFTRARE